MGPSYSYLEAEKVSWLDHSIQYDDIVRKSNLISLEKIKNGADLWMANTASYWGNLTYEHWFITDGTNFIEFGSASSDIYKARVTINTYTRDFEKIFSAKMNDDVRERISNVLGMSNYSLALRNCEHVSNYILKNRWLSCQMNEDKGELFKMFSSHFLSCHKKIVNTFPSNIRPHFLKDNENKIYSFFNNPFKVTGFHFHLDDAEDTYNILLVGPTGAGKSHFLNILFNQHICDSEMSLKSVTREIYFVRGRGDVFDENKKTLVTKDIIVADTVGLCDTDWSNSEVIDMIKGRINANCVSVDVVFIVFRGNDPLKKECIDSIKKVLEWLNYNTKKSLRFRFVGTHCESIDDNEKKKVIEQLKQIFSINDNTIIKYDKIEFDSIIFTGFPPEKRINFESNLRKSVEEGLHNVVLACKYPGDGDRIKTEKRFCSIL